MLGTCILATIPLASAGEVISKRLYLGLYDEFVINFGANRGPHYLDQKLCLRGIIFVATLS
jgi:hypothetical protein